MCNSHHGGNDDREVHSLSPEMLGPKAYRSIVRGACFLKHFWAPNNVIKYDGETNPSVWLEDNRLACMVGGANEDLFIIQFLPIYLADMTRAWLDHLLRKMIGH
jgi:hypothetical protein